MKATISYQGVRIETEGSPIELQALIFALKDIPVAVKRGPANGRKKRGRPRVHEDVAGLTSTQSDTWAYLASGSGARPQDVAEHFGITVEAARQRLVALAKLGAVHVDDDGLARAGEVPVP